MNELVSRHNTLTDKLNKKRLGILRYGDPKSSYFRYRSCNTDLFERELEYLAKGKLYFSSLAEINDPFDARPVIEKGISLKEFQEYIYPLWEHLILMHEYYNHRFTMSRPEFRRAQKNVKMPSSTVLKAYQYGFEQYFTDIFQNRSRIFCLTTDPFNNVMWSMYSDRFNGYCVELASFSKIFRPHYFWAPVGVRYHKDRPVVDYADAICLLCDSLWELLVRLPMRLEQYLLNRNARLDGFHTKQERWSYEKEYRIIKTMDAPGYVELGENSIVSVTVGHEVSDANTQKILRSCSNMSENIGVYKTELSSSTYDVSRIKIN